MSKAFQTKSTDSKGRLTLGEAFANLTLIVEVQGPNILLRPARVIPESESWLYENETALSSLRRGLKQAREGRLSEGPDLDEAAKLADSLEDS